MGSLAIASIVVSLTFFPFLHERMYPVRYIQSETPILKIDSPYIENGEIETRRFSLTRGQEVRLVAGGAHVSSIEADGEILEIDNSHLSRDQLQAMTPSRASVNRKVWLRKTKDGPLEDAYIQPGTPFKVIDADLDDYNASAGLLRWYQIETLPNSTEDDAAFQPLTGYIPGSVVQWLAYSNASTAPAKEFQKDIPEAASLGKEAYPQPDWKENSLPDPERALNVSLPVLFDYSSQIEDYMTRNGFNTLIVTLKDENGKLSYLSDTASAFLGDDIDAAQPWAIDMDSFRALVDRLKAKGIFMAARLETFLDPLLAQSRPDLALCEENGTPALLEGSYWTSPYEHRVWQYNLDLALESCSIGFQEIQFDSLRFPAGSAGLTDPNLPGRTEQIDGFLYEARNLLEEKHVYTAATLEPDAVYDEINLESGQSFQGMRQAANRLYVLPYLQNLQLLSANYGIEVFGSAHDVLQAFTSQLAKYPPQEYDGSLCVSLQGFGLMSPQTLQAQIQGVLDGGQTSYAINTIDGHPDRLYPLEPAFQALSIPAAPYTDEVYEEPVARLHCLPCSFRRAGLLATQAA